MSSRSPSPETSELSNRLDTSFSSTRKDSPSHSESIHHSITRGEDDDHQPETTSGTSESYFKPRRQRKHSDSSSHTRRYSRRSHSRSKSPVQTKRHHYRRSQSRSKSPQEDKTRKRDYSRRSRSRSRSQSPSHRRRFHGKKSRSRSPSKRTYHTSRRSRSRSRSRSKSPVRHRRDYSRRSHSRSRSPPPSGHSKKSRSQEYTRQHDWNSGNRRSYQEKKFYHKDSGGKSYHRTSTPIAKVATSSSTPVTTREQTTIVPSLSVAPLPALSTAELQKLTPEQKLERALLAAQAVTPKINAPQPSISALSTTSATVPLLGNPPGVQKKKLLWNKKTSVVKKWEGVSLGEDGEDNEAKAKFRRLMGMSKGTPPAQSTSSQTSSITTPEDGGSEMNEKHEKLRRDLEQQYEASRYMTHLARGSGLGFGFSSNASS